ncbi:MAG: PQQ-like beta-propeller repeat protein [Opitutaceae bacterium]|nr:PQQ-like beta-propeller repeat protein [Verrucomicrobiales bacterium]
MMTRISILYGCALGLVLTSGLGTVNAADATAAQNWHQWRGPLANGVAPLADPPLKWSETENVKWKVKTPGFGTSTPIIWGDKLFLITAIPTGKKTEAKPATPAAGQPAPAAGNNPRRGGGGRSEVPDEVYQFTVMCLDRKTGKTLWQKVAREQVPHEGHHQDHGFASASPTTDGKLLLAYFGSRGLYCYDLDGNLKWEKDFGDMRTRNNFGEGTSPVLSGDTVIINWDHEGADFIVALDKNTGKELWRKERDEPTSWSTPLVVTHDGKTQVVVNATGKVRSYDVATGAVLWEVGGQTVNAIPSPVTADGVVYVMSGFRGSMLQAIKLGRTGDLAGTDALLWTHDKSTPYVPSPLLYDGQLYFLAANSGILSSFDVKTGKALINAERLPGVSGVYASPVGAKDRVYLLGREGTALVLKKGAPLEVLATNKLDDRTDSSIAAVGKELFIRGHQYLYCIAEN